MMSSSSSAAVDDASHFTPFDCFPVAAETTSGLLELQPGEVSIMHRSNVQLRSAMTTSGEDSEPMVPIDVNGNVDTKLASSKKWKDRCSDLLLQLTTHRVVLWKDSGGGGHGRTARFLSLALVMSIGSETEWFKSPKILVSTVMGDVLLVFTERQSRDDVLTQLQKAFDRKEWEKNDPQSNRNTIAQKTKQMTSHKVGVDAIMSKNKMRHLQAQKLTDQALAAQDADTLMKEATELVSIINKYVATLERSQQNSEGEESAKLVSMLQDMGMTSALSKADFGGQLDRYHEQLARQIADVIRPKLKAAGGVLSLTDVYVAFNRARASNLLSPEDLRHAVSAMDSSPNVSLGMRTRTFPSGLVVLELDEARDTSKILVDGASSSTKSGRSFGNGLNELEAARLLNTSAMLAHEQLILTESKGLLCRDEQLEMTRFYPNRFEEWAEQL